MDFTAGPRVPPELIHQIVSCLVPTGNPTIADRNHVRSKPVLDPDFAECRRTLWACCLALREFYVAARPILYRKVLIEDFRELLCFFRTLMLVPYWQKQVQEFAWLGSLPQTDHEVPAELRLIIQDVHWSTYRLRFEEGPILRALGSERGRNSAAVECPRMDPL